MSTPCLAPEALWRLASGGLADPERDAALAHLDGCDVCLAVSLQLAEELAAQGAPSDPTTLAPGARVGRYEVEGWIGSGTSGRVARARDLELDRPVALKQLAASELPGLDRERVRREARAAARLSHPAVVQVFELVEHAGGEIIVMEWIEGQPLDRWLAQRPPLASLVRVFRQVALGLAALHAQGLVHGDVKPANILVNAQGDAKLVDLGFTHAVGQASDVATGGSPAYMTAAQLAGAPAGPASDQHAFFVTLYEAVEGRRPYPGPTLAELRRQLAAPPPPTDGQVPWLGRLIRAGLRSGQGTRYRDMANVAYRLDLGPRRRFWIHLSAAQLVILALVAVLAVLALRRAAPHLPLMPLAGTWTAAHQVTLRLAVTGHEAPSELTRLRLAALEARADALVRQAVVAARTDDDALAACVRVGTQTLRTVTDELRRTPGALQDLGQVIDDLGLCDDRVAVATRFGNAQAQLASGLLRRLIVAAELAFLARADTRGRVLSTVAAVIAQLAAAPWAEAEAEILLGRALAATQRPAAARAAFLAARRAAAQARDPVRSARAAIHLAYVMINQERTPASALAMLDLASADLPATAQTTVLRAQLLRVRGLTHLEAGDLELARRDVEAALALARTTSPVELDVAMYLTPAARVALAQGRLADATRLLEEARRASRTLRGPEHAAELKIAEVLAPTLIRQGRAQEAIAVAQEARALAIRTLGVTHGETAKMDALLASMAFEAGDLPAAHDVACPAMRRLATARDLAAPIVEVLIYVCLASEEDPRVLAEARARDAAWRHFSPYPRHLLAAHFAMAAGERELARRELVLAEAQLTSDDPHGWRAPLYVLLARGWARVGDPAAARCRLRRARESLGPESQGALAMWDGALRADDLTCPTPR